MNSFTESRKKNLNENIEVFYLFIIRLEFDWIEQIRRILENSDNQTITFEKLKKEVDIRKYSIE